MIAPQTPDHAVAYQGAPGAYSEEAAQRVGGVDGRMLPCRRLEDVFDLTKIESRPITGRPFEYRFIVELRSEDAATLRRVVAGMRLYASRLRVLGTWAAAPADPWPAYGAVRSQGVGTWRRRNAGRCIVIDALDPSVEPSNVLAHCRERIDRIDGVLLALLWERMLAAVQAAEANCALGQSLLAPAREAEVLECLTGLATTPLDPDAVSRIPRAILDETLNAQHRCLPPAASPADTAE